MCNLSQDCLFHSITISTRYFSATDAPVLVFDTSNNTSWSDDTFRMLKLYKHASSFGVVSLVSWSGFGADGKRAGKDAAMISWFQNNYFFMELPKMFIMAKLSLTKLI